MGDPECQTILPKLKTDIFEIILACCEKRLNEIEIEWSDQRSLCVVICANGYPENFEKNIEIKNLDKIVFDKNDRLFHAGTIRKNNKYYAVGGRVLNFVSLSNEFITARNNILEKLKKLNWKNGFYRKDIGYKVINK